MPGTEWIRLKLRPFGNSRCPKAKQRLEVVQVPVVQYDPLYATRGKTRQGDTDTNG
jgi:hypothetical protein